MQLYAEEPWGPERADLRAALICSTIANYAGKMRAQGTEPASPADFMPFSKRPVEQEPDPLEYFNRMNQ